MDKICIVENCNSPAAVGKKYCSRHYAQLFQKGQILEKSKFDPNPYRVVKDLVLMDIFTYSSDLPKLVGTVKFEKEFLPLVLESSWIFSKRWKAVQRRREDPSQLMKLIINDDSDKVAIPINGDPFDCRKENIKLVTISERLHMTGLSKRNTSGVRGVTFDKSRNAWKAQIVVNRKTFSKRSETIEEAVENRIALEIEHLGKQMTFLEKDD